MDVEQRPYAEGAIQAEDRPASDTLSRRRDWLVTSKVVQSWNVWLSLAIGAGIWELVGSLTNPFFLVPFSEAAVAAIKGLLSGEILWHAGVSLAELAVGFLIGMILGAIGGTLAAFSPVFRNLTDPWLTIKYTMPTIVLFPLLVVWFGIGVVPIIALVIFAVFVPVWLNTQVGVMTVDRQLIEVARTFDASRMQTLRWVVAPAALPAFIIGLRLSFSRGFIAVIVGEFLVGTSGLGHLISSAAVYYILDEVLGVTIVLVAVAVLANEGLKWMQRKLVPWWEVAR